MNISGAILLNKPRGITSFQALSFIKRITGTKKVGHTGTLDKFASGLLVVLIGKMTRAASFITNCNKVYRASLRFGLRTDTLDPEGNAIAEAPIPDLSSIKRNIDLLTGVHLQIPPKYSAVHVNGQRAGSMARQGTEVQPPAKSVTLYKTEILFWDPPDLVVDLHTSKGFYVRSFARDLGRLCESEAYCISLMRTNLGPFTLLQSVNAQEFSPMKDIIKPLSFLTEIKDISSIEINDDFVDSFYQGKQLFDHFFKMQEKLIPNGIYAVTSNNSSFMGLISKTDNSYTYEFVGDRV